MLVGFEGVVLKHKVLAISNRADLVGGGEHSFLELISTLPAHWESLVVLPARGDLSQICDRNKIKYTIIALPRIRPHYGIWNFKAVIDFCRQIRKLKPGLVYANGSRAAFYGGIAGRLCGVPSIFHCRIADRDPAFDTVLGLLNQRIIANSRATAARFSKWFRHKTTVVYNGLNLEWLNTGDQSAEIKCGDDAKVVLVAARLSRWKRHDLAIDAFNRIGAHGNIHLVCVGGVDSEDPEWADELRRLSAKSKFGDRIHWVGNVSDIRPWYKLADVLLLPSENEPFGRVIVEAMAHGIPIVATNGGGVPELIREGEEGGLVDMGNTKEMAAKLMLLLHDAEQREKISIAAKKRAESFSLKKHVARMDQIFKRISNPG